MSEFISDKVTVTFPARTYSSVPSVSDYSSHEGASTDVVTRAPPAFSITECAPGTWAVSQQQQRGEEDRYQAKRIGPFRYFAVFDGHGGSKYKGPGHIADYAVEHLHERLAFKLYQIDITSEDEVINTIQQAFIDFDAELYNNGLRFGCTCAMILIHEDVNRIYQVNLGDSRSLIFDRKELISVTQDHTPSNPEEKERIEDAEGTVAFGRLDGVIAVSRAFGDFEFKGNRTGMYEPIKGKMSTVPNVKAIPIVHPMHVLLTSDAPFEHAYFTNDSLMKFARAELEAQKPLSTITKNLVASVIKGSTDDTTIVLVNV